MPQAAGKLISIEGGEGAGKSTVLEAVRECLVRAGKTVVCTREPGGTDVGEGIRRLLLDPAHVIDADAELLLMFASRAQLAHTLVQPAIARGDYVISDRFTDASFAYQGGGRGLAMADIAMLEARFVGLRPDLTLLLDVPVAQGMARAEARGQALDRIEREQHAFFLRVRETYLQRAAAEPARIRVIDASQPASAVVADVQAQLEAWMTA